MPYFYVTGTKTVRREEIFEAANRNEASDKARRKWEPGIGVSVHEPGSGVYFDGRYLTVSEIKANAVIAFDAAGGEWEIKPLSTSKDELPEVKKLIERWLIMNVSSNEVPGDEGSDEGLLWNLIRLLHDGPDYEPYDYSDAQIEAIEDLRREYGT